MSRKRAIDQFCKQCIYDPHSGRGTWRQQTEGCTATECPLYGYRPRSASDRSSGGASADSGSLDGRFSHGS